MEKEIIWQIRDFLEYGFVLERKARVADLPKIGICHVYNDHQPPHFHIKINDSIDAKFHIQTLEQIAGNPFNSSKAVLETRATSAGESVEAQSGVSSASIATPGKAIFTRFGV